MRRVRPGEHAEAADLGRPGAEVPVSRTVRLPVGRDDEIAAGVHEVQNALQGVLGWLEIAKGSRDGALRDRALKVIEAGVHRAQSMAAKLSDPAGRFGVTLRAFRVVPVVAESYELLHPRCASVGVTLTLEPSEGDLVVLGDPDRVVQILTNLVLNAVDAILALPMREHGRGRIVIGARGDEREIAITVHDDGVGMDEATLARAFEPYFTTHANAVGRRGKGTGLGLAIARALAEAMQGRLAVTSTPGMGSEVTLALLREGEAAVRSTVPPPEEHGLRAGTRVLVVDDEPAIRELLEVALTLRGADVTTTATLGEARHALAHNTYDVVLVDETLGANDSGAALVVDLGRTVPGVACVLMTGAPSVDHLPPDACKRLLRKPFSLDEAVRLIAEAIEKDP